MEETQFNPQETLTRKEYLKQQKKKNKRKKSKITYVLITGLLLISVYVFTQLYVYSANRNVQYNPGDIVYEDYFDIYYAVSGYTYNTSFDLVGVSAKGEEKKLLEKDGLSNLQKVDNKIYGLKDKKLYSYDIVAEENKLIIEDENIKITKYIVHNNMIYFVTGDVSDGKLYMSDINGKNVKEIYSKYVYQISADNDALYVVTNEQSNNNLIKIKLSDYSSELIISDKVVNNISLIKNNIYFSNGSDQNKLYRVNINNYSDVKKISDNKVFSGDKNQKHINGDYAITEYKDNVYFISTTDGNKLCMVSATEGKTDIVLDIQLEKMKIKDRYIFYTVKNELGLFSYNIETKDLRKVCEKRFSEFVM